MSRITRKIKREKEEQINFFEEFIKLQKHFFKDIFKKLKSVKDPRHQSYIEYVLQLPELVTKQLS